MRSNQMILCGNNQTRPIIRHLGFIDTDRRTDGTDHPSQKRQPLVDVLRSSVVLGATSNTLLDCVGILDIFFCLLLLPLAKISGCQKGEDSNIYRLLPFGTTTSRTVRRPMAAFGERDFKPARSDDSYNRPNGLEISIQCIDVLQLSDLIR